MSDALAIRNASNSPKHHTDDAIARIVKLVPGEAIAAYNLAYAQLGPTDFAWQWVVAFGGLIVTFLIRRKSMEDPTGNYRQWGGIFISCVSFLLYVYASGGPFLSIPEWYNPRGGAALAIIWGAVGGTYYEGPKADNDEGPKADKDKPAVS